MGKLTVNLVKSLTDPGTYEDSDGLRVVITPTGSKNWVLRF
jgi:hypothetical protein